MITNRNFNVHITSFSDKKLMYDSAKVLCFNVQAPVNKSTRYWYSHCIIIKCCRAEWISKKIFLISIA